MALRFGGGLFLAFRRAIAYRLLHLRNKQKFTVNFPLISLEMLV